MIINPIIPIWLMAIICIVILVVLRPKEKLRFLRQVLIVILLFVINLRFMKESSNVTFIDNEIDVLFVIDSTLSMVAEDYNGKNTRLSAVKSDCEYIINKIPGARYSIITFDNTSKIIIPYTRDSEITLDGINSINVLTELYARGSSLNSPKELMKNSLENVDSSRKQIVFFMSDGEITSEEGLESYSEMKKYINDGAVLGYGTTSGGRMRVKMSYYDNTLGNYLQDTSEWPYKEAISVIDEKNLKQIASDLGIDYINMNKQSNIDSKLNAITNNNFKNAETESKGTSYLDIYYIFSGVLCILLVIEFISYKRRI